MTMVDSFVTAIGFVKISVSIEIIGFIKCIGLEIAKLKILNIGIKRQIAILDFLLLLLGQAISDYNNLMGTLNSESRLMCSRLVLLQRFSNDISRLLLGPLFLNEITLNVSHCN
jgi:hypothetical protein